MCVAAQNREKNYQNPLFWGFKVVDLDVNRKGINKTSY